MRQQGSKVEHPHRKEKQTQELCTTMPEDKIESRLSGEREGDRERQTGRQSK